MTAAEMHIAVKILVDKEDSLNYPNLEPEHLDYFLNLAQDRFVKHRYDGAAARGRGFEKDQKRLDDLKNIVTPVSLIPLAATATNYPNGRYVNLPSAISTLYWFSVTEQADVTYVDPCSTKTIKSGSIEKDQLYIVTTGNIVYNGRTYTAMSSFAGTTVGGVNAPPTVVTTYSGGGTVKKAEQKRIDVKPIQHDDYNIIIRDPFNKPSYQYELKRLEVNGQLEIIFPDSENVFNSLILRYIRKPRRISLSSSTDCELADHTHQEIVDMAVSSILENIESERYKTNLNELNKLE